MDRFIFGRGWVYEDEADDGTQGGAGGAASQAEEGADGAGDEGGDGKVVEGDDPNAVQGGDAGSKKPAAGEPKDMLDAITKGLEKTAPPKVDEDPAAKKAAEDALAAAAAAKLEKHANGQPKKDAKGNELDDKGQVVKKAEAPKAKTSAELSLSKEQLAALKPESRARFQEVITTLKARETEIATLAEQIKPLTEARDAITSILQETMTTPDQLSAYLEFNRMLQSGDAKDLENALEMVENQRVALYKSLGREPNDGSFDLLKEFPDLAGEVEEAKITRERALEIANARRAQAAAQARGREQQTEQQRAGDMKKSQDKGLADITAWTAELSKKDIDYKAKEEKLLEQVDEVIKTYPPNQWLATLKLLYQGIVITKAAPAVPNKESTPLRPSGAKPGAKAPQNMFEAMWGTKAP